MRDVLVIQWTRLGDLLHTRVLLNLLRRLHPDARIALSYDARYDEVVRRFPEVDVRLAIDINRSVDISRTECGWPDALDLLIDCFRQTRFDLVINLTNHASACRLAQAISSDQSIGYAMRDGKVQIPRVLLALQQDRAPMFAPCHIADLWCEVIDPGGRREVPASVQAGKCVERTGIALIADAGAPERSLSEHALRYWSEVIRANDNCSTYWTGARRASDATAPNFVTDLRGHTSLRGLCEILSNCKHVIGPDTGALHLAAAIGCETIGVYLDKARPERTGPYVLNSMCLVSNGLDEKMEETVARLLSERDLCLQKNGVCDWLIPQMSDRGIVYSQLNSSRKTPEHSVDLSIIITEFGQTHYADQLLAHLKLMHSLPKHEIIVISSGLSGDDEVHIKSRQNVVQLSSNQPQTFSAACNRGATMASGEWLLFLNDDLEVTAEAIRTLWNSREERSIVAPELQYWDHVRQSVGISVRSSTVVELGMGTSESVTEQPDGVSAAVMLISRKAFHELRGFDESFANGFEDVDFCLRAKQHGIKPTCIDSAKFIHYRGSSPQRYDHDIANEALFWSRWKDAGRESYRPSQKAEPTPLLILSSSVEHEAGPQSRWIDPLIRLDGRGNQFKWICTSGSFDHESIAVAIGEAKAAIVFRHVGDIGLLTCLLRWKNETGRPLILDADDLILNRFSAGSVRAAQRKHIEDEFSILQSAADICTASSSRLLELHQVAEHKKHVLPSRPVKAHFVKRETQRTDDYIRIGITGSPAHQIDFAHASDALEMLLGECDDVLFYWWGCHPGKLAYHPQVRHGGPWLSNYAAHLERLHRVPIDFWILPLSDSVHNSVRSPIRAFECCGMSAPALVSNVDPYRNLPADSKLLVKVENNLASWLRELRFLVARVKSNGEPTYEDSILEVMRARHSVLLDYQALLDRLQRPHGNPLFRLKNQRVQHWAP